MRKALALIFLPFLLRGDIAFLLHESTGTGGARFTDAGHAAVYLTNVCAASAIQLRLCKPGETGAVITSHSDFGERSKYEWNASSLPIYLYGVEHFEDAPLLATDGLRSQLRERYRKKHIAEICPEVGCGMSPGRWRDMVAQLFMRDIYGMRLKTTAEQDARFIQAFNAAPNINHFNSFTNNCADFAGDILNTYFPGAARADHVNDFGMTSPKAVAKSVTKYGEKHPELQFVTEKYSQINGCLRRSKDNRKGTEVLFRSKKWLAPLLVLEPHELGVIAASYYATGRYSAHSHYERTSALMPDAEWAGYRAQFEIMLAKAIEQGIISERGDLRHYFQQLERETTPGLTEDGVAYLQTADSRLYLTRGTILGPGSDHEMAYRLLLAKVDDTLRASRKNRENAVEFRAIWNLLQQASNWAPGMINASSGG